MRTVDSDTDVGLLEGGGVVDTVSGHAHNVLAALEDVDDLKLVLGEDLSKAVSVLHQLVHVLYVRHLWRQLPLALLCLKHSRRVLCQVAAARQ